MSLEHPVDDQWMEVVDEVSRGDRPWTICFRMKMMHIEGHVGVLFCLSFGMQKLVHASTVEDRKAISLMALVIFASWPC
eukprot:1143867-Pelagomonas_calceolata.AAC.2